MWFLFDELGLIIVIGGTFCGGFMPLFILLMMTPEAREHIKTRIMGGIIIDRFYDTGQEDYLHATPKGGEGQYMAGKNAWGQRQIFVKPRVEAPFAAKAFFLNGIRRPKYFCYAGKTPIVNVETLMAIEVAEAQFKPVELPSEFRRWAEEKYPLVLPEFDTEAETNKALQRKALPPNVTAWAKENGVEVSDPVYGEVEEETWSEPDEHGITRVTGKQKIKKIIGYKNIHYPLYSLDARKLRQYFSDHYDESQVDNLLEAERLAGAQEGREGKKIHFGKLGWIMIALIAVSVIGIIILYGLKLI